MSTQSERYSVAETAARCGISTSALTRYVKRGLIPAPQRQGSKRTYSAETIAEIPTIRAALLDARVKKLAKAPAVPIPDGRLSVRETANRAGISVSELGMLKRQGVIPQPERYGRSLTYGADLVPVIKAVMEERRMATNGKRSKSMKELWKDQDYRDLATFGMSKPKRRKPQTFSAEFLAHRGQLKDPRVWKKAKEGQQRFLNDPQRYSQWIDALTTAANRPSVRLRRSAKMKIGITAERAELEQRRHQGGIKPQPLGDQIRDLLTQGCKPKEIIKRLNLIELKKQTIAKDQGIPLKQVNHQDAKARAIEQVKDHAKRLRKTGR